MMDWTDRHCRVFHRLLTRRARLYTEMLTAPAVLFGNRSQLLAFDATEHPVALQLGGADPAALAEAAALGEAAGYDEINLNIGCPSDRVQSGRFGACLMAEPRLVADCVSAMRKAVTLPVTVKCRIGIDDQDPARALPEFTRAMIGAGCETLIVHARKALLAGLSPKENRTIPPLDYPLVYGLKEAFPGLRVVLNGGIASLDAAHNHLRHIDGVMIGRAAYQAPALLGRVDCDLFGEGGPADLEFALRAYGEYMQRGQAEGTRLSTMTRPLIGLFQNRPGARAWRRILSEEPRRPGARAKEIIEAALEALSSGSEAQMRAVA